MELVNKNYVKMTEFNIFHEMIKASDKKDEEKYEFLQKLLQVVMKFKNNGRRHVEEFYVDIKYFPNETFEITRNTIMNALAYATINGDFDMIKEFPVLLYKDFHTIPANYEETYAENTKETLGYILNHSISIEEYLDGEKERFVFNPETNSIEKDYIYNHNVKLERRKK